MFLKQAEISILQSYSTEGGAIVCPNVRLNLENYISHTDVSCLIHS